MKFDWSTAEVEDAPVEKPKFDWSTAEVESGTLEDTSLTSGENASLGVLDFLQSVPVVGGVLQTAGRQARGEPLIEDPRSVEGLSTEELYKRYQMDEESGKRALLGIDETKEADFMGQVIRAASDPTTLVGLNKFNTLSNIAKNLTLTAANTGSTVSAVTTQRALQGADWYKELPPVVQDTTSALLAGAVASASGSLVNAAIQTGSKVATVAGGKVFDVPKMLADARISAKVSQIKQSVGEGDLAKAMADYEELKTIVPELEGSLPFVVGDNPLVQSMLRQTGQESPQFHKDYLEKVASQMDALIKAFDTLAGEETVTPNKIREGAQTREAKAKESIERINAKRMSKLDEAEAKLHSKLWTGADSVDIGAQIETLHKARLQAVQDAAGELYTNAFKVADEAGLKIPSEMVQSIWQAAKAYNLDDIFKGGHPAAASEIKSKWGPEEVELPPQLVDASGRPLRGAQQATMAFKDASVSDLDSLKRRINYDLRKTKDSATLDNLEKLKKAVQDVITELSNSGPEGALFASKYREADAFYYRELGVPTSTAGMKAVDAAKFESAAANHLNTFEKARDFINFVGPQEGLPVLQQALRLKAINRNVVDGEGNINTKALKQFMKDNGKLIELAGMQQEFADVTGGMASVAKAREQQQEWYNKVSYERTGGFFKALEDREIHAVIREMNSTPKKRAYYVKQIDKLPKKDRDMIYNGLRRAFMDEAVSNPQGFGKFVESNKEAAAYIFGKDYLTNLRKLGVIADKLKIMANTITPAMSRAEDMDAMQAVVGASIPYTLGQMRNQVISVQRKMINIASTIAQSKGGKAYDAEASRILLDPNAVEALANPPMNFTTVKDKGLGAAYATFKYYVKALSGAAPLSGARATQALEKTREEERYEQERQASTPQGMLTGM